MSKHQWCELTKLGRRAPCHCGSGRRYKNCCYTADAAKDAAAKPPLNSAQQPAATMGFPGEESYLTITFVYADGFEASPAGQPGDYDIMLYFRRPGASIDQANISFDTEQHDGTSLLAIANPALVFHDPKFDVPDTRIKLYVSTNEGQQAEAFGFPNKDGFLSDMRTTLTAANFADAEKKANLLFNPLLSAIAFSSDVPLEVSRTVIREKATSVARRGVTLPFPITAAGIQAHAQPPEARVLFNRYRDAINSSDPNWRFLCFASIAEQLWKRTQNDANLGIDLEHIVIPVKNDELAAWFRSAFPKSYPLGEQIILDSVPSEARGETTNQVIKKYIRPLRTAIAHSLLEDGALPNERDDVKHLLEVRKWLPILRCITRVHLRAVYGPPDILA